jgi:hypothetical protein
VHSLAACERLALFASRIRRASGISFAILLFLRADTLASRGLRSSVLRFSLVLLYFWPVEFFASRGSFAPQVMPFITFLARTHLELALCLRSYGVAPNNTNHGIFIAPDILFPQLR